MTQFAWKYGTPITPQTSGRHDVADRQDVSEVCRFNGGGNEMLTVMLPSIDPTSPKNMLRDDDEIASLLLGSGLAVDGASPAYPEFRRADGSTSPVTARIDLNGTPPVPFHNPFVVQVSRWDRLKDMSGVLRAFADGCVTNEAHLVLAGPAVKGVSDDPEGATVLADCITLLRSMPESVAGHAGGSAHG